jgi:hypothetical protein
VVIALEHQQVFAIGWHLVEQATQEALSGYSPAVVLGVESQELKPLLLAHLIFLNCFPFLKIIEDND